ncbi:CRIB domain-containing protein RIC10 isoform X2 [Triticum aestivum]|uniref:CRIB domain-containing protein RIC10 isoform X2 n=1 Tax=Triticum aestivum TaxID=4565 RepID=UPI001D024821|nr:CRIB domain-containing protein RIC10-like isoform X2 [Triticum aestivum]
MAYKMKGVFKGLRIITQIFVVKEQEMEIGHPIDVKHVAHIGWDSPTGSAATSPTPSWMNNMNGTPDVSTLSNSGPSTDFDHPRDISAYGIPPENSSPGSTPYPDIPKPPRKARRKKSTKNSSPTASSRSSRSSRSRSKGSLSSTTPDTIGANDIQREIRIV